IPWFNPQGNHCFRCRLLFLPAESEKESLQPTGERITDTAHIQKIMNEVQSSQLAIHLTSDESPTNTAILTQLNDQRLHIKPTLDSSMPSFLKGNSVSASFELYSIHYTFHIKNYEIRQGA